MLPLRPATMNFTVSRAVRPETDGDVGAMTPRASPPPTPNASPFGTMAQFMAGDAAMLQGAYKPTGGGEGTGGGDGSQGAGATGNVEPAVKKPARIVKLRSHRPMHLFGPSAETDRVVNVSRPPSLVTPPLASYMSLSTSHPSVTSRPCGLRCLAGVG